MGVRVCVYKPVAHNTDLSKHSRPRHSTRNTIPYGDMSYVNNYTPAPAPTLPESELYGPEPYDINFAYPLHEDTLQNARTKLVPFLPAVHAEEYWKQVKDRPETFRYYPFFFPTLPEFLAWFELTVRRDPHSLLFAVIDKTRPDPEHPEWAGRLAGVLGMYHTAPSNLATEVAFVVVFPDFRGTHIAKDMVGLLLRYILALPTASRPGIGFRRVAWAAHPKNTPSIRLAERMGFKREGLFRYMWVLPDVLAKEGNPGRVGDAHSGKMGRDSVLLGLCWDDWENGAEKAIAAIVE
ncbi:acyl-CoA N-acyltransferase [Trametes elegans]|nr:acyl-CoA N-acyltransferase [Trametes elegans]